MRFTLGITTKYIDRHPTASMTNNLLPGNVNKAYALEHMNVVFSLVATAHLNLTPSWSH
jgi:hypothetical protein